MAGRADPIIRVVELTARYGDRTIFERVSFEVRRGEVFAILGGSGSGKSTLLKHMIGLLEPAAGHVWIDGEDIAAARGEARRRILRRIGVMYQQGALFGSMTLLENVRLPLEEFTELPADALDRVAASKLKLVQLAGFEHFHPAEISGGMRKRAAIARAMALDPGILFLDEPSAGLDPITSAELDDTILRLSRSLGVTFVVVTHELPSIYTIADRVIMLDGERRAIVAAGTPEELRDTSENDWVRRFFRREGAAPRAAAP
jgi:phospholipid/cholesterol/gamma-HCH transport system ATP-binding protein